MREVTAVYRDAIQHLLSRLNGDAEGTPDGVLYSALPFTQSLQCLQDAHSLAAAGCLAKACLACWQVLLAYYHSAALFLMCVPTGHEWQQAVPDCT